MRQIILSILQQQFSIGTLTPSIYIKVVSVQQKQSPFQKNNLLLSKTLSVSKITPSVCLFGSPFPKNNLQATIIKDPYQKQKNSVKY